MAALHPRQSACHGVPVCAHVPDTIFVADAAGEPNCTLNSRLCSLCPFTSEAETKKSVSGPSCSLHMREPMGRIRLLLLMQCRDRWKDKSYVTQPFWRETGTNSYAAPAVRGGVAMSSPKTSEDGEGMDDSWPQRDALSRLKCRDLIETQLHSPCVFKPSNTLTLSPKCCKVALPPRCVTM